MLWLYRFVTAVLEIENDVVRVVLFLLKYNGLVGD